MFDNQTFGPRLRRQRERCGITLESMAGATKVGVDLWEGMEQNDFSRWPAGIFARAFVREYATRVGLDADAVVNEFCRLFPKGDRRARRVLIAQGELIGHRTDLDDPALLPPSGERRAEAFERRAADRARRLQAAPRVIAILIDAGATLAGAALGSVIGAGFWRSLGVVSLLYYGVCTAVLGTSGGLKLVALSSQLTFSWHWLAMRRRSAN